MPNTGATTGVSSFQSTGRKGEGERGIHLHGEEEETAHGRGEVSALHDGLR